MNYSGKHVLVLGLGESGLAMARWLDYCGAAVRVADTRDEAALAQRLQALRAAVPGAVLALGQPLHAGLLDGIDFVAVSPGLSPLGELAPLVPAMTERDVPLWSEIELFAQALSALREDTLYQPKVLAVTGTNGKTTVTSLTGMLCQRAGLSVKIAGNISPAALDVLREAVIADRIFLAELAAQDEIAAAEAQAEAERLAQQAAEAAQAEAAQGRQAAARVDDDDAQAHAAANDAQMDLSQTDAADAELTSAAPPEQNDPLSEGDGEAIEVPVEHLSTEAANSNQGEDASLHTDMTGNEVASLNLDDFMQVSRTAEEDALVAVPPPPPPEPTYRGSMPQAWVLELSSFQLHATHSLKADAATVLNLSQDHLDWHGDMQAYAADKARVFGQGTVRVLNRDDALVMQMNDALSTVSSFGLDEPVTPNSFGLVNDNGMLWLANGFVHEDDEQPTGRRRKQKDLLPPPVTVKRLMPVDALKIRGAHNAMNALAALALCRAIDLPMAPLLHGLRDYTGEPHRVELVAVVQEVEYYDDSKGTNVGATVAALNGLGLGGRPNRIVLIAGGDGKGQDFSPLALPVEKYASAVLLIGRDALALRAALAGTPVDLIDCTTLEEAVQKAGECARTGDIVLLSPACASLDMFRNYAHRAEVFVDAVRELALSRGEVIP